MIAVLVIPVDPVPLAVHEGGVIRVAKTRVTLDLVIEAHLAGASPDMIVQHYDSLDLSDVYAVIAFYLRHRNEVDAYLEDRRRQADAVRRQNEARWPADGLKERLLARRDAQAE
jgi:uncharacterized protein (DUF433 family)